MTTERNDAGRQRSRNSMEIYVLANWEHFEAIGRLSPDITIRHYERNPEAFTRDRVAVERRRDAAAERLRKQRESQDRASPVPAAHAIIEEVRSLSERGMSEAEIAQATGCVLRGVVNALRIINGQAPIEDIHLQELEGRLGRMDDDVR